MTDFVVISPDGEMTEHDGYASDEVGCHGAGGQMLYATWTQTDQGPSMLRMTCCDCALLFPEWHRDNPVAGIVLAMLGYGAPVRGRIALYRVGWDYEPVPLRDTDLSLLRALLAIGRGAHEIGASLAVVEPVPEVVLRVYRDGALRDADVDESPCPE